MEKKSTRLRFVSASTLSELTQAVEALPFKVEIKGMPQRQGSVWYLFFTIPDNVKTFESVDING